MTFDHLSSHALTARLGELLSLERRTIVEFLLHLVELERRSLHLELGYSSLFVFCTEHLKLSKGSAFRRTTAARLIARYPSIAEMLRDGRLNLAALCELRDALDDATHVQVLERAAGKTEDQIRELVAALRPRPAPTDLFRRLPTPAPALGSATELRFFASSAPTAAPVIPGEPTTSPAPPAIAAAESPAIMAAEARRPSRATITPISEERRVLRLTVSRDFTDDLMRAKALLSHLIPNGDLEQVLHACVRKTIAVCEKRRRGSDNPRAPGATKRDPQLAAPPRPGDESPESRNIPTDVRREVWRRDAGACTFVGTTGHRCNSTHQIQFHHLIPYGRRGPSTVANITLRCRIHNQYAAELDYGRDFMRRYSTTTSGVTPAPQNATG